MNIKKVNCPYCGRKANFKSTTVIYGERDYGMAYICSLYPICDSYVGVHKGTANPLGIMANAELRSWKKKVHALFDPHWQNSFSRQKERSKCYSWLAAKLGISKRECHIGMFNVVRCQDAVKLLQEMES